MIAPVRIGSRYELQDMLGEGGMGVVYRGLDVKTGAFVAVKTMRDFSDPVAVELFTKEWKVLAEMSHPNIVDIRDVDVIEEQGERKPFFVMPLLQGVTLSHLIETASPRLTVDGVVEMICQVCRGLQAAHQRGLVHRDLKPSNIFIMDDDTAKIIDFGVVHLAGSKSITGHKGTWQYMAPEQAELKPATPASDIFSLGVVCYEALTLRKPFAKKTAAETIEAVRTQIPRQISEINPNVNQLISMVIHKALAKQPIHRFLSARDFADTLQKAYRNQPIERFDRAKIQPRIERARKAFTEGDHAFASDILTEIEAEGHLDPEITHLRSQIEEAVKQKKIRQLLESARSRLEQDEIPLALDKVREILEIDPENGDALTMRTSIERQRNERQIEGWLTLTHQHLDRHDFSEARQALREVLAIRPGDQQAAELLTEINSREQDAIRIRGQKEQLYGSALKAYQSGEISSALSRLERILTLARQTPEAAVPERDAVYQSFYNQVRTERDYITGGYEEGRRYLREKNFAKAADVCDQFLVKYPNDALFHALKLEVIETQRQELSSYIAEVGKRVESEPDLDRRVNLLKEACDRYPNEQQFAQTLKLVRERRDLINSIVAKARQYEERGQFAEGISQWDILRNIHPQYPGIDIEVEQLVRRREQQSRDDDKSRVVEQIEHLLESGVYLKARDLAASALRDFPGDPELAGLDNLAEEGRRRSEEARRLFEEGQRACTEKRHAEGAKMLQQALDLEPRNSAIRDVLINALVEQARAAVDGNWHDAEPLLLEAAKLDERHPAVRSLRSAISDAKRKEHIAQSLSEARNLQAAGDMNAAMSRVKLALREYPNEPRLEQHQANLQNLLQDAQRNEELKQDEAALDQYRRKLKFNPGAADLQSILEVSQVIRKKHPDDPQIGSTVAEIEQMAKQRAPASGELTSLFSPTVFAGRAPERVAPAAVAPVAAPAKAETGKLENASAKAETAKAKVEPAPAKAESLKPKAEKKKKDPAPNPPERVPASSDGLRKKLAAQGKAAVTAVAATAATAGTRLNAWVRPGGKWSALGIGIPVGFMALIISAIVVLPRFHRPPVTTPVAGKLQVQFKADPPDATIVVDGEPLASDTLMLSPATAHKVEVSRLGYLPQTSDLTLEAGRASKPDQTPDAPPNSPESKWNFKLEPEPVHIRIQTSEPKGRVQLDGKEIGELVEGAMPDYKLVPDGSAHRLGVAGAKELFAIEFHASPGSQPQIKPVSTKDLLVVSSLGPAGNIYSGTVLKGAFLSDQPLADVTSTGVPLSAMTAQHHELKYKDGNEDASVPVDIGNAPVLWISYKANPVDAHLSITSEVEGAKLSLDGKEVKRRRTGWQITRPAGTYSLVLSADGYEPFKADLILQKGETLARNISLKALATSGSLHISGATPGAEVILGGKKLGVLDSSGEGRFANIAPGQHSVELRKEGYESDHHGEIAFSSGSTAVELRDIRLKELGTLALRISPKEAKLRYRRLPEDPEAHELAGASLLARAGKYEITAEAAGYESFRQEVQIVPGKNPALDINLKQIFSLMNMFEDPDKVEDAGNGWLKSKLKNGEPVFLHAGPARVNLVLNKPPKSIWGARRKVQWLIVSVSQEKIVYELEDQKLTRKLLAGPDNNKAIDRKENSKADASARSSTTTYSIHIEIDGNHVMVTSDSGGVLDDYTSIGRDFTHSRVGIRTDDLFLIRSN